MSKQEKPQIVHNLEEFLAARGFAGNEPYTWARCFYEYTDCGPWSSFFIKKKDAFTRQIQFAIGRNKAGRLAIVSDEENIGERDLLEPEDIQAFGFEADRTMLPSLARSLKQYRKLAEDFAKKTKTAYSKITVHPGEPYSGYPDHRRVWISATQDVPAELEEIYYLKVGKAITERKTLKCGCRLREADVHADDPLETVYVACDPDPKCPMCHGKGTYERDIPTDKVYEVNNANCAGVEFGSIVEGSDAYSGPFTHMFPFDMADFERDVQTMKDETNFYWERDNSIWLHAREIKNPSNQYFLHNTWGEIKWDSKKPKNKKLQAALEEFANSEALIRKTGVFQPLTNLPTWEIAEIANDTTF